MKILFSCCPAPATLQLTVDLSNGFSDLMIKKHAYLLQQVGLLDGLQHVLLGRLLGLSAQQELIQDEVCLLKVEDNIQLAHL